MERHLCNLFQRNISIFVLKQKGWPQLWAHLGAAFTPCDSCGGRTLQIDTWGPTGVQGGPGGRGSWPRFCTIGFRENPVRNAAAIPPKNGREIEKFPVRCESSRFVCRSNFGTGIFVKPTHKNWNFVCVCVCVPVSTSSRLVVWIFRVFDALDVSEWCVWIQWVWISWWAKIYKMNIKSYKIIPKTLFIRFKEK